MCVTYLQTHVTSNLLLKLDSNLQLNYYELFVHFKVNDILRVHMFVVLFR